MADALTTVLMAPYADAMIEALEEMEVKANTIDTRANHAKATYDAMCDMGVYRFHEIERTERALGVTFE